MKYAFDCLISVYIADLRYSRAFLNCRLYFQLDTSHPKKTFVNAKDKTFPVDIINSYVLIPVNEDCTLLSNGVDVVLLNAIVRFASSSLSTNDT